MTIGDARQVECSREPAIPRKSTSTTRVQLAFQGLLDVPITSRSVQLALVLLKRFVRIGDRRKVIRRHCTLTCDNSSVNHLFMMITFTLLSSHWPAGRSMVCDCNWNCISRGHPFCTTTTTTTLAATLESMQIASTASGCLLLSGLHVCETHRTH